MDKTHDMHTGEASAGNNLFRLLLIEDSDADAAVVQKTLEDEPRCARYTRASTIRDGEDILSGGGIDVLLLDLGLPDTMDATDTYTRVRKWADKLPVIIMTSIKDHSLARTLVHEGAADFLNKDNLLDSPDSLKNAIDFSIERHNICRKLIAEKNKLAEESKQKDTVLSCFMGNYTNGGG